MSLRKSIKISAIFICLIFFFMMGYCYCVLEKGDIVYKFKYFTLKDNWVFNDKNNEFYLIRNSDDETVLSNIMDYYMLSNNEILFITTHGYYIFLGKELVYYEKYDGNKYQILHYYLYSKERGKKLIAEYVLSSWYKTLKKYNNKVIIDPKYIPNLKYLHYRDEDSAIIDMTSHNLITYAHNIKLNKNYIYIYSPSLIRIISLDRNKVYSIELNKLDYRNNTVLTFEEFNNAVLSQNLENKFKLFNPTIYEDIIIKNLKEIPVSSEEVYEFYVESYKKYKSDNH